MGAKDIPPDGTMGKAIASALIGLFQSSGVGEGLLPFPLSSSSAGPIKLPQQRVRPAPGGSLSALKPWDTCIAFLWSITRETDLPWLRENISEQSQYCGWKRVGGWVSLSLSLSHLFLLSLLVSQVDTGFGESDE